MRRIIAISLVLATVFASVPAGSAQATPAATVMFKDGSTADAEFTVDLLDNAGQAIRFALCDNPSGCPTSSAGHAFASITAAVVLFDLDCTCAGKAESMQLGASKSGNLWVASLAVNSRDLVKGTWDVRATGVSSNGVVEQLGPHKLIVTVDDVDAPVISIDRLDVENNTVLVGADEAVLIGVEDNFTRFVTYRLPGMPKDFELSFPYALGVGTFKTGSQPLTLKAYDRAGHVTTTTLTVYADDVLPVLNFTVPSIMFVDVANTASFEITEHSNFTVTARMGNEIGAFNGTGSADKQTLSMQLTPTTLGRGLVEVRVVDLLGNIVTHTGSVLVKTLETDLKLNSATLGTTRVIAGETQALTLNVTQSVSPVPVTADVLYGNIKVGQVEIAPTGNTVETIQVTYAPGIHNLELRLAVPAGVTELDPSNQNTTLRLEVFLGRVVYGSQIFHIRGDTLGRPTEAVAADGTRFPTTAEDRDLRTVYTFTADGQKLFWDPSELTTTVVDEEEPEAVGEDSPGLPIVALLALVAIAAALRRRD